MPATAEMLETWFDRGKEQGARHLVIKCDNYGERCCYPEYVMPGKDGLWLADYPDEAPIRTCFTYFLPKSEQAHLFVPHPKGAPVEHQDLCSVCGVHKGYDDVDHDFTPLKKEVP